MAAFFVPAAFSNPSTVSYDPVDLLLDSIAGKIDCGHLDGECDFTLSVFLRHPRPE
jgi:hypothetical protein